MYSVQFKAELSKVLDREGRVLTDRKGDRGGRTFWGISQRNWPDWSGWILLDNGETPDESMVTEFYHQNFWLPIRGDETNNEIAAEMFDTAVNQGVGQAVKCLQRALNLLNPIESKLKDDGGFGSKTKTAYDLYFSNSKRNKLHLRMALLRVLNFYQMKTYEDLVEKDLTQKENIFGWVLNRIGF